MDNMSSEENLMLGLLVVKYAKDLDKLQELVNTHPPEEEVKNIEEFRVITGVFGLSDACTAELWEGMLEAKKEADAEVEGGVLFTYKCAISSIALSLSTGKCKDCEHNPSAWKKEGDSGGYTIQ